MAIDFLRGAPRTASSRARSAMPRYTAAISDSGNIAINTMNGSLASPAGTTRPMRASGTNTLSRTVSWLWVAPLAQRVPRFHDANAGAPAFHEGVDRLRATGSVRVDGVRAEPGPRGSIGAELLAAGQAVAALHPFGARRRQQDGDVVARLGMAGGDDLTRNCRLQQPPQGGVAGALQLRGHADPVGVHGHRQGRRRRVTGEATLSGDHLGEIETPAAEMHRHGGSQVAGFSQLGQVFVEVRVCSIEVARSSPELRQHLRWQLRDPRGADRRGGRCCAHGADNGPRPSHRPPSAHTGREAM
jgi:hypothetical protein